MEDKDPRSKVRRPSTSWPQLAEERLCSWNAARQAWVEMYLRVDLIEPDMESAEEVVSSKESKHGEGSIQEPHASGESPAPYGQVNIEVNDGNNSSYALALVLIAPAEIKPER